MKKDFVEYPEALALKELGFDEPCLKWFMWRDKGDYQCVSDLYDFPIDENGGISAPLYQQAFRWFREKYDLHPYMITLRGKWIVISIIRCSDAEKITGSFDTNFNTLEEAELACLEKLIEIVKEK